MKPQAVAFMLEVQFGQATDFGKVRKNNEDAMGSFLPASRRQTRSHGYLFAVADGVGGMDLGEVASDKAISVLTQEFSRAPGGALLNALLPRLIQKANFAVHDCSHEPQYEGKKMATTLVACALRYDQAVVSHVGDSRCYLVRGGRARLVTQDHTWVNEQKKLGLISAAEIPDSASRHALIRSLGPEMFVAPDTTTLTVLPGDIFVLCTDGIHDEMEDEDIAAIVSQDKSPAALAADLVARAVEMDGGDNTTAQVLCVRAVERIGMYRGRPYRLPTL